MESDTSQAIKKLLVLFLFYLFVWEKNFLFLKNGRAFEFKHDIIVPSGDHRELLPYLCWILHF